MAAARPRRCRSIESVERIENTAGPSIARALQRAATRCNALKHVPVAGSGQGAGEEFAIRCIETALLAAALALALLAPGCGASSAPSPGATAAGTAAPSATAPAVPTVALTAVPTATAAAPTASPAASATPATPATPVAPPRPAAITAITLSPALGGRRFDRPVELGAYPGGRVFVADQGGLVLLLDRDGGDAGTLLDLRGAVLRGGNEEGLLSVALDPDFARTGYLYAYYSAASPRRSVLARFHVAGDAAEPGSRLVMLEQPQPFANHNGGAIRFGPDGMLYLGFGDGGGAGDPQGHGQNPATLLGTLIRIDVRGASAARPYAIPSGQPSLPAGARPEVWAYGFRNPWRMAFDPVTGGLWVGDVGQEAVEEIDVARAGGNYGWNRLEGDRCYSPPAGCDRSGTVPPVATYTHAEGCSVTGGVVYRGRALPSLAGSYLYSDFCSGRVWALPAGGGGAPQVVAESRRQVSSFGEDADGEVYLLTFGGPALRITAAR